MAYTGRVMRTVWIVGLILLAVVLPLAALPVAVSISESRVFVAEVVPFVCDGAQPAALLARPSPRGPPSR